MNTGVKTAAAFILAILCYVVYLPVFLILSNGWIGLDPIMSMIVATVFSLWLLGGFKRR